MTMQVYIVEYESNGVCLKGYKVVQATSPIEARNKFMMWLKAQPEYDHMWQFNYRVIGDDNSPFIVLD